MPPLLANDRKRPRSAPPMITADVAPPAERLLTHLARFARALRRVGLAVSPQKLVNAVLAVQAVGLSRRGDLYWALHAVFVNRPDQREFFDQVFFLFWRSPGALEGGAGDTLPQGDGWQPISRRVAEALLRESGREARERSIESEFDARLTWSSRERLKFRDFEEMSGDELAEAQAAMRFMAPLVKPVPGRRFQTHPRGTRIDMRRTLRASMRAGPDTIPLIRRQQRDRPPSFVVLCDISGSMSTYSRVFLHFAHAMGRRYPRVSTFLFATRLTNVTRCLRDRDVDRALSAAGRLAGDWEGGTRIGQCLRQFNRDWSRRVLAQVPTVLLVSDGLDRDAGDGLTREIERLHKSCRTLIWLNPLLRYDEFQPLAAGIRAILPHVDEFRSIHNLESVAGLAVALSRNSTRETVTATGLPAWDAAVARGLLDGPKPAAPRTVRPTFSRGRRDELPARGGTAKNCGVSLLGRRLR